jgi:hypothetical protein
MLSGCGKTILIISLLPSDVIAKQRIFFIEPHKTAAKKTAGDVFIIPRRFCYQTYVEKAIIFVVGDYEQNFGEMSDVF